VEGLDALVMQETDQQRDSHPAHLGQRLADGGQRRFGLYFVDFGTQRRLPKRSAAFYSVIARSNALPTLDGVATAPASDARAAASGG